MRLGNGVHFPSDYSFIAIRGECFGAPTRVFGCGTKLMRAYLNTQSLDVVWEPIRADAVEVNGDTCSIENFDVGAKCIMHNAIVDAERR